MLCKPGMICNIIEGDDPLLPIPPYKYAYGCMMCISSLLLLCTALTVMDSYHMHIKDNSHIFL